MFLSQVIQFRPARYRLLLCHSDHSRSDPDLGVVCKLYYHRRGLPPPQIGWTIADPRAIDIGWLADSPQNLTSTSLVNYKLN